MSSVRLRYEEPQRDVFNKPHYENISEFSKKLLGLYTFETEDKQTTGLAASPFDIPRIKFYLYSESPNVHFLNDQPIPHYSLEAIVLWSMEIPLKRQKGQLS